MLRSTPPPADRADGIEVRTITDEAAFLSMREEWNRVATQVRPSSVFFLHEWFVAAWQWSRLNSSLFILCAIEDGRLVAILPLVRRPASGDAADRRRLEFLTVPDTQRCDVLVAGGGHDGAIAAFARSLQAARETWDEIRLSYLDAQSTASVALQRAFSTLGHRWLRQPAGLNFRVRLDGEWDAFYGRRSKRFKSHNKNAANRLRNAGTVEVRWIRAGEVPPPRIARALEEVIRISSNSWKADTGNSLDQPGPQAFIRSLTRDASDAGWLSIWLLELNGEAIAMEYQLIHDGMVHALRSDFLTAHEELSAGAHLNHALLQRLFGRGLSAYYMGPGKNAYKMRWTTDGDALEELRVFRRSAGGTLRWWLESFLKPRMRRVRDALSAKGKDPDDADERTGKQPSGLAR